MPETTVIQRLPELLSPAGSPEALEAAAAAGADAVYFGGAAFSNRMRARNFSSDEMTEALQQLRAWQMQSYITINTRVRDAEMPAVLAMAETLLTHGASGFIVADMGIAAELHARFPDAPLHASTQMTLTNAGDGDALAACGFTRMVAPREITLAEAAALVRDGTLEVEMFLHGAYCVSLSGQCLMSWAMGGRSGNRGECAQPCRLPYTLRRNCGAGETAAQVGKPYRGYPLSLRDMCLAAWIPEIIEAGIHSLKIEGRQKSPAYVYGVTKQYRTLLDERRAATEAEVQALDALFSRDGFTDGYFRAGSDGGAYRDMLGVRPPLSETKTAAVEAGQVVPPVQRQRLLRGRWKMEREKTELSLTDLTSGKTVCVFGEGAQTAEKAPLSETALRQRLGKLGGTPFAFAPGEPVCEMGNEPLWMPVSSLNAIRRAAVDALTAAVLSPQAVRRGEPYAPAVSARQAYRGKDAPAVAVLTDAGQWTDEMNDFFETVYFPASAWEKPSFRNTGAQAAVLPETFFSAEALSETVERLAENGVRRVLCHGPGEVQAVRAAGMTADGSFRLNVWNRAALAFWYAFGVSRVTLSPELPLAAMRDLARSGMPGGAIVYGRIPLMTTERCIVSVLPRTRTQTANCAHHGDVIPCGGAGGRRAGAHCGVCYATLTDRLGVTFPVRAENGVAKVYNSVPICSAQDTLPLLTHRTYLFTIETKEEIRQILADEAAGIPRAGRRLR